jgi:hypothetical protein
MNTTPYGIDDGDAFIEKRSFRGIMMWAGLINPSDDQTKKRM